eukprot:7991349-Ditylum_brightwellii.AAC.1
MKINNKSLEFANQNIRNKPPSIPFYMPDNEKKLSPLDYQTYKLQTNLKGEKSAVYNLVVPQRGNPRGVATVHGSHHVGHQGSGHIGWRCSILVGEKSTEGECLTSLQK